MRRFNFRKLLIAGALMSVPLFVYFFWNLTDTPQTLSTLTDSYQEAGTEVRQDLATLTPQAITEEDQTYTITDTTSDGIDISFANEAEPTLTEGDDSLRGLASKSQLTLSFPKDYSQPIEVRLDDKRTITITDLGGKSDYQASTLSSTSTPTESLGGSTSKLGEEPKQGLFEKTLSLRHRMSKSEESPQSYLRYTSGDKRKELLYAYQKDQATGEKKLKHWTLYQEGNGVEQESYQIENAKLKITEEGRAEVFYYGEQDLKNDQAAGEVDSNLLERAQRTLAKEMGDDLLNRGQTPDLTIPKPYYIDKNGEKHDAEWKWSEETSTLSVSFTPESYPVALDPTLSFTAPGTTNSGSVITGEAAGSVFGSAMVAGDWNADGKTDLAVSAYQYSTNTGRVYIFYNDGFLSTTASGADVIVTGETTSNYFGASLASGDYNADGKTDLAVGAWAYSTSTGRTYFFYGGSIVTENASGADAIVTGETTSNYFGYSLASGDYNADGKTDLAVSAYSYSTSAGRAYIFYNGSIITENASGADVLITGEISSDFGIFLISGDYNADGKTDLAVGADRWNNNFTGRAYIFYNGSIITEAATGADIIITGETTNNFFGYSLASGDWNADGKTDLAVGAFGYSTSTGRAYIFYNGSIITEAASGADVIITGETANNYFSYPLASGDYNADGKTDLAMGASGYSSTTGRAYIFYNDGSIPATAATADVIITGERTGNNFGASLVSGDWNVDGKTDLAVGASTYAGNRGRTYIFYSQNGQVNTNQSIVGETTSNEFGYTLATGDWNADGRIDLAVSARTYSTSTGRVYIFYGDGQIPSTAATADIIITGETASDQFGYSLAGGDLNADGRTDLIVGARAYSTSAGRAYIFYGGSIITENASGADIILTGEASSRFGQSLAIGDYNTDGKADLAVGGSLYTSSTGRVYIFNSGSIITEAATGADTIITGNAGGDEFGWAVVSGDFNTDGRVDLAVSADAYSTVTGRTYIFYNDGSIPTTAATADVTITGNATNDIFGQAMTAGDLNADGRTDLIIGAGGYSSTTGRAYIFYNDGSIPTTAATADVTITGSATADTFGRTLVTGDLNADGRVDLIVGANGYSSLTGRTYIFYNDGSIPTTAATADVTITGDATADEFGFALAVGDMNADGRMDLIVGANKVTTSTGKVYFYETRENFAWEIQEQFGGASRTGVNGTGQELQITGETGSRFGSALTTGDFNADGRNDLAVGAWGYSSSTGRAYIFYGDGSLTVGASSADVIITGETASNFFGWSIASGDWNADGKTDLAVGASYYSSSTGRAYLFYNDGSFPASAVSADIIITGAAIQNQFGYSLVSGDFDADGTTDLAVGAYAADSGFNDGRVYLFYNDGSIPTAAASADVKIDGTNFGSTYFGYRLASGDWNADGRIDLAVGAHNYSSSTGRVYIFYNDGSIPTTAATADIIITGEAGSFFGWSLTSGDWNADGKTDLAVGAYGYSSFAGRVYIFYNGSIITEAATGADIIITGEASSSFSSSLVAGDYNADGRTDLAVGASGYSTNTGRAYIFYNDGSIPTTAVTADVILTGETTSNYFGYSLASGDWNADGRTDLAVGAYIYSSNKGKVYIYTFNDPIITGETTSNYFGYSLASGDLNTDGKTDLIISAYDYDGAWNAQGRVYIFYSGSIIIENASGADVIISNAAVDDYEFFGSFLSTGDYNADGRIDLAVGALGYSSNAGRAYIFYNDGSLPTTAATADITITGEASSYFGSSLASGDWNADGKIDLAVGAYLYSSSTGRAYIFYNGSIITEAATGADVIITGETSSYFGISLASGDFNTDGKTDLAVSAYNYSSATGRAYIFYNGSIITEAATGADVIITGEASSFFGRSLASGDFNADGKTDLAIGGHTYSTTTGRVYLFHNDGSYPSTAATADIVITGEATNNSFGVLLVSGDWNADGKTDLAVGANGYSTNTGRVYTFYNGSIITENASGADVKITGEATSHYFGATLVSGDWNADGKTDLAVGTYRYSSFTGRVYLYTSEVSAASILEDVSVRIKGTQTIKGHYLVK